MSRFAFVMLLLAAPTWALAEFPTPYNNEPDLSAPLMPAAEAAASLSVPEGFRTTLMAAEPDVQNPIAMAWDARGRLWIAENYTYGDDSQHFDLELRDRVLIFEDTNGDGHFDKRTVFTDDVQMLTSIEVGHGGVWLVTPPNLLFIPDADGDDRPDGPAKVVLDGFKVAQASYHNFANGLRWGPDGWLYGRCGGSCPGRIGSPGTPDEQRLALEGGIWRYHPLSQHLDVLTSGTTNPWGHDWTAEGELFFINTVNGHLWHGIPGAHFTRPFTLDPNRRTYELIDTHADHWHFDTGKSWTDSRHGAADAYGGGHAHIGMMIYLGNNWPQEYRGRLFTLNMHGRRANQEILERNGSGYVGRHAPDMLQSGDPWFRGMDLSYGPDGSVYVIDWSDTGECHERTGVHRQSGRIFRVAYGDPKPVVSDVLERSPVELAQLQFGDNEWLARKARVQLAHLSSTDVDVSPAIQLLEEGLAHKDHLVRLRSLWTIYATGGLSTAHLTSLLEDSNEHVRAWAVRLSTDMWPLDDTHGPVRRHGSDVLPSVEVKLPGLVAMAASDPSPLVRLALASTLQRLPLQFRAELAAALVTHAEDADDHNIPLMIWYGLMAVDGNSLPGLVDVAAASKIPKTTELITRRLAEEIERQPEAINRLLEIATKHSDAELRSSVLIGLSTGLRGWRKAPQPKSWPELVAAVADGTEESQQQRVRELSVVFGDGRALDEVKQMALDGKVNIEVRLSALETLIENRPDDLRAICEPLLKDARMNTIAARGLALSDDPEVGEMLVSAYGRFRAPSRPQVVSLLVSRKSFAEALLKAIAKGRIPREDLSAFQVRQIHSLDDAGLSKLVGEVWGEMRDTPEERRKAIATVRELLSSESSESVDLGAGRALFAKTCSACHRLYGEGGKIGPDLTGANRSNLDFLLENILDPSAVVSKDYRMSILQLEDGRVLNGLVTDRNDRTVTIRTATEQFVVEVDEIEASKVTPLSPMPEGLLETLTPAQIRNLFGYLQHPSQVPLPAEAN